ncbi:MAG: hypothetical protein ACRD0P_07380 [Stackebrandtia sp.]
MRHIASLLAGLVIAPLTWILIGAATIGLDPDGLYKDAVGKPNNVVSMAMFAVAGIALGLLAVSRMSPAGPLTAAVLFGGLFGFFRFVAKDFTLPDALEAMKVPTESATASGKSGVVLAIAALMAMAMLMPSRWRGPDDGADRVVNTSELSSGRGDGPRPTDGVDPFAPTFSETDTRAPMSSGDRFPSVGNGFDERPTDPFATGSTAQQQAPPVPEQRSPYADDAYSRDGYGDGGYDQRYDQRQQQGGYAEQQAAPRYGDAQQQQFGYGNEQQYR